MCDDEIQNDEVLRELLERLDEGGRISGLYRQKEPVERSFYVREDTPALQ
jgi:hypothetical protein